MPKNVKNSRPAANFELAAYPGLLVKDSYWRWPQRNLAGPASVRDH